MHGNTFEIHRSMARLYRTWRVAGMCAEKDGGGRGEATSDISKASNARGSVNTNEIELMRILKHKAVHIRSDHLCIIII